LDNQTRLLIAEEQTLLAEGLRKLLESEFLFVEMVRNASDLVAAVESFQPDLVLLGVETRMVNGLRATRQVGKISRAKVIMVSAHDQPESVDEAVRAGASGYVLRRCTFSELLKAIRHVLEGQSYVTPLVARHGPSRVGELPPGLDSKPLTCRQREVLQLVAEGYTAKEIATSLNLSVKTAVFHRMAIRDKLGLRTTAALTRYALENGMLNRSSS
jgi:DNA-binding NarL/FixJ family response regulator